MRLLAALALALACLVSPAQASHRGPVQAAQLPAFTGGDCTITAGSVVISCSTLAGYSIGTSGAKIPLLSQGNTWSAGQVFAYVQTSGTGAGLEADSRTGSGDNYVLYNNGGVFTLYDMTVGGTAGARWSVPGTGLFQIGSGTPATGILGEAGLPKITASGTAPGAGYLKLSVVAGTNSGTCKIIAYAGTSTTPVTIVDNVGSGC